MRLLETLRRWWIESAAKDSLRELSPICQDGKEYADTSDGTGDAYTASADATLQATHGRVHGSEAVG